MSLTAPKTALYGRPNGAASVLEASAFGAQRRWLDLLSARSGRECSYTTKILKRDRDGGREPPAIDHQRKNEKTFADFKRVAEQTGILTKEADDPPQQCCCPRASRQAAGVDA